jgi:hypothetical protein
MHRLGSVLPIAAPIAFGPGTGAVASPANTWQIAIPADPVAKFLKLHVDGSTLDPADRVEIDLGYDTDVFTRAWGADFWSRPIKGPGPVTVRYIRTGVSAGIARIDKYGRGEAIRDNGSRNSNGDLFMIDTPYVEPSYFPPSSVTAGHTTPSWQHAACVADPVIAATAKSVGMYVIVDRDPIEYTLPEDIDNTRVSSCTATLIAPDLVITAGHCVATQDDIRTGAITFDFAANCDLSRPAGYSPKFYKMVRLVETGYLRPPGDGRGIVDYSIVQIETPPGGLPIPPIPFRPASLSLPICDPLFIVHHRRGTSKKVSTFLTDPNCKVDAVWPSSVNFDCSVDFGASGSSIFDSAGRIVANLTTFGGGTSATSIWEDVRTEPVPTRDIDVVVVLDRSGSMSLPGRSGAPKLTEARQAAALFVSLLTTAGGNRVGLVSFSTTATPDRNLSNVNPGTKGALVGPIPPATAGLIGGLTANGMTTIGGGLQAAVGYFPVPTPTTNTRAVLLMTDGLENTVPMIAAVEPLLAGSRLNIVGFGTPASIDGPRLTTLARTHDGIYVRADDGLTLKKYFALAFGRIFDLGTALDPDAILPAGQAAATPVDVDVCGETSMTVVLGWASPVAPLRIIIRTPAGATIDASSAGVDSASGDTWEHLTFQLPYGGEQGGRWQVIVARPEGGGELAAGLVGEPIEQRYFVSALATGGPAFNALPVPRLYTGDPVNPLVYLREPQGGRVAAEITVDIESPANALGEVLASAGLGAAGGQDGDVLDQRTNTLLGLERQRGELVKTRRRTETLFDDGLHGDGGLEADGVYGQVLTDLTAFEGTYTFRAVAVYGEGCRARREITWAAHVDVGIDGGRSDVRTDETGGGRARVTVTPKDRFGNRLGPGRLDAFGFMPIGPGRLVGDPVDNGDGSYSQTVDPGPVGPIAPGLAIAQPDRPPTTLSSDVRSTPGGSGSGSGSTGAGGGFGSIRAYRRALVVLLALVIVLVILVAFLIGRVTA